MALVLHLDAGDLALSNDDPVSTWVDASASSNDATGVTTQRPLFKTNVVNSLPALLFDGTDDVLQLDSVIPSGAVTVYVVCKPSAEITTASGETLMGGTASARGALHLGNWTANTTGEVVSVISQPDPGFGHIAYSGDNLPAEWVIISFRINTSVDSKWTGFFKAQSTGGTGSQPNATTRPWQNVNLIGANSAAGASPFNGHIAEIKIYDSYLADEAYRDEISSLATKYALTTPTLTAANVTQAAVQAAVGWAIAGETVTIPEGEESWTTGISVSAGISVIGATTVNSVAGTANDQTIIIDNVTGGNTRAFTLSAPLGETTRLSGITFNPGSRGSNNQEGVVGLTGSGEGSGTVRLDNCNLFNLEQNYAVKVYSAYGVIDHNIFRNSGVQSIHLVGTALNGDTNGQGDSAWLDYPWFGTSKFMFIEDNYMENTDAGNPIRNCIDGDFGGRWVVRHNHLYDTQIQTHGTESRVRGVRATEIYNNDLHFSVAASGVGGMRTGPHLIHDNTVDGTEPSNWISLNTYRIYNRFNTDTDLGFGGANGANPWDVNDISDGTVSASETLLTSVDVSPLTFTNGAFEYTGVANGLYLEGTATAGTNNTTVEVSGASWTTNMWVGFVIKQVSTGLITIITANDSNTLTVHWGDSGGSIDNPNWVNGDDFEIRRALITLDQPGRGKTNTISGGGNESPPVIESGSGDQAWPDQALEPVYNWNNIYDGVDTLRVLPAAPISSTAILVASRDYYNDENIVGDPEDAVIATYVAALNGVDYLGPYEYPHPLVGAAGPSVPDAPTNLVLTPFGP